MEYLVPIVAGLALVAAAFGLGRRVGRWWIAALPWLPPVAFGVLGLIVASGEDADACQDVCGSELLLVFAWVTGCAAAVLSLAAVAGVSATRRRRSGPG